MSDIPPDVSRENFRIEGSLQLEGTLLPSDTDLYDLGSDERRFRDLWLAFPTPEHEPVIHIGDETFTGTDVINARNVTRVAMSALQPYDHVFKTGGVDWWKHIVPVGTPTTVHGYSITDAYVMSEIDSFYAGDVAIDGYNKFDWDSTRLSVFETSGNWNEVYENMQGSDSEIENLKINQQLVINPANSNHTITLSGGYIHGPNTLYIDPFDNTDQTTKEDVTGTVVVLGNLQVEGTTTTINSTEVAIVDKTIELAKDSTTPAQANGAGLTVAGANANITYNQPADRWEFNKGLKVSGTSNVDGRLYVKSINDDVTGGTLVLKHANNNTTDVVSTIFFENNAGTTSYIQAETVDDNLKGQISFFTRDGTTAKRAVTIDSQQRVGIGTNNPTAKLDLHNGTNAVDLHFTETSSAFHKLGIRKEGPLLQLGEYNNDGTTFQSSILVVDAQGDMVGIGHANPVVKLDIDGTDAIKIPKGTTAQRPAATTATHQGYIRYNTTTSQFEGFGAGNSWGSLGGVMDIDQDTYISPETAPGDDDDTLRFFTGGVERFKIDNNGMLAGLSTSTGSSVLRIARSTSPDNLSNYLLNLSEESDSHSTLDMQAANGISTIRLKTSGDSFFNGGNVGIGTTNPSAKLEVFQDLDTSNGASILKVTNTRLNTGSSSSVISLITDEVDGNTADVRVQLAGSYDGTNGGKLDILTNNGSSLSPAVTIKHDGNVGIGTTSPGAKIHVNGGASNNQAIFESTDGTSSILFKDPFGTAEFGNRGDNAVIMPAGVEKMRIDSAGNVEIGHTTSSPQHKLSISGSVATGSSGNSGIAFHSSSTDLSNATLQRFLAYNASVGNMQLYKYTNGTYNGSLLTIDSAGNVGIGTTSPGAKLSIKGNVSAHAYEFYENTTSSASECIHRPTTGEFAIRANSQERLRIDSNGNVGIGTTNPDTKLHIYTGSAGTFTPNTNADDLLVEGDENTGITIVSPDDKYSGIILSSPSDPTGSIIEYNYDLKTLDIGTATDQGVLRFRSGSFATAMTINSSGDVGVGTTNPGAALDVHLSRGPKLTRFGNDTTSQYVVTGMTNHTLTFTCGSYYQAEVVITANQTNAGNSNNIYIRGIWSNNYTNHEWNELENVGAMTGSTLSITNTHNGGTEQNGKLIIQHDYLNSSFSRIVVRITEFFGGGHTYTLT